MDPRWLLGRRPEDGLEDGNVLLEEDGRDGEVPLQLVGAPAEVLRQAGHVLPLFDLVEELNQAAGQEREASVCWTGGLILMLADVSCRVQVVHRCLVPHLCAPQDPGQRDVVPLRGPPPHRGHRRPAGHVEGAGQPV